MMGDCRMSKASSTLASVAVELGMAKLSHTVAPAPGVVVSPSPVCQMPYLFRPAAEVWNPHNPDVLYSHIGLGLIPVAVLDGCRIGTHPPFVPSKFQGTLSPAPGPLAENRMPRSRTPSGTMSASLGSRMPLLF